MSQESRELLALLEESVKKNAPRQEFGILFSGGLDSLVLAALCKGLGLKFRCFFGFVEGLGKPKDLAFAEKAAKALGLGLNVSSVPFEQAQELVSGLVELTGFSSPVHIGVSLPVAIACAHAREQGIKLVFSGAGADELFCGYAKFRLSKDLAADCMRMVQALPGNDLKRDSAIASANGLELRTPFLSSAITKFALSLPKEKKLSGERNKIILRELALELGFPEELAERRKVAAQYGSNADKAIEKLAKRACKTKSEYLAGLQRAKIHAAERNRRFRKPKLAALFSGGKDSCLALWKMQRQGFPVKCLVSVIPENSDSFMYHKPDLRMLKLQSKALGIPLVIERTPGIKERELSALHGALSKAKKRFGIEAVVSGALYSSYQRERIQKLCDSLSLELFSPLWRIGQEAELRELAGSGFVFVMAKVAALGLSQEWLGAPVGEKEIMELEALNSRVGFNVAGEGGEYESLVLDAPNFAKRIKVLDAERKMENEFTGTLLVKKATLEEKR